MYLFVLPCGDFLFDAFKHRLDLASAAGDVSGKESKSTINEYRAVLQKHTLSSAREYLKLQRRVQKERRNYDFLLSKMKESEDDLVQVSEVALSMHTDRGLLFD